MLTSRSIGRKVRTAYIGARSKAVFKSERLATLRILAMLIAASALVASIAGVTFPALYRPIASDAAIPFAFGQDAASLVAAILLLATIPGREFKTNVLQAGIVAYMAYAYAPYVMGTLYTHYYFFYMAVFGLSIFYFITWFASIEYEGLEIKIPDTLRIGIAVCCIVIVIYFAPQWITAIWHDIQTNTWPEKDGFRVLYYVYILDLCFVLPVCAVTTVLLLQKKPLGFLLGGVIMIFGFALMVSVTLGFACQSLFGQDISFADVVQFSIISLVFLLFGGCYILLTKVARGPLPSPSALASSRHDAKGSILSPSASASG
jgi:hypothetical protein